MPYNLTESQKDIVRWMVREVRAGKLPEEFWVYWVSDIPEGILAEYEGEHPPVTQGGLDALAASDLILSKPHNESHGGGSRKCTVLGNAFAAVDSDFDAPETPVVTLEEGLRQGEPQETRDRIIRELEDAISEFEQLLNSDPDEERVQLYLSLDRNKILLEPSAENIIPKLGLGSEYVTDFVIQMPQQRYILVEIEKPGHLVLTRKGRVTAKVTDAQQQVEDWLNWVRDYPSYAQSIMPGISEPRGWVIIGRREDMSLNNRRVLTGRNANLQRINLMTFDDLLDRARQHLENLRKLSA